MRLLNANTLELSEFHAGVPPYAILVRCSLQPAGEGGSLLPEPDLTLPDSDMAKFMLADDHFVFAYVKYTRKKGESGGRRHTVLRVDVRRCEDHPTGGHRILMEEELLLSSLLII
jgi:hypothetical protein